MGEMIKPISAADVIGEENKHFDAVDLVVFSEWVFNNRLNEIKEAGLNRVLATISSTLTHATLQYLGNATVEENQLADDYVGLIQCLNGEFEKHEWETFLLHFLIRCGFVEPEVKDGIRSFIDGFNVTADLKKVMQERCDVAAIEIGMTPIFSGDTE